MKLLKLFVVVIAGLALPAISSRAQLSLDFSATTNATIQFNGSSSSFQFNSNGGGNQWVVTSENGGSSAVGLFGLVNNGPFSYGSITSGTLFGNTVQSANVTGSPGALIIQDGTGFNLTGNVNWETIQTFDYSGAINAMLTVNVTDLSYAGSNPDLQTLVAESPASLDVTFQFSPGMMLNDLTSGTGPYMTSFSGSLSVVPEPTTAGCLLLGLGALVCARRFKKR
ncbi:MAG: PEP-CTERM sorting domain-containing protein [Limisphaerales bacterium]